MEQTPRARPPNNTLWTSSPFSAAPEGSPVLALAPLSHPGGCSPLLSPSCHQACPALSTHASPLLITLNPTCAFQAHLKYHFKCQTREQSFRNINQTRSFFSLNPRMVSNCPLSKSEAPAWLPLVLSFLTPFMTAAPHGCLAHREGQLLPASGSGIAALWGHFPLRGPSNGQLCFRC